MAAYAASWKLNRTLKAKQVPYLAIGAAFSFVIMLFNIPVVGGTTGHATGATLVAILIGPWAATIAAYFSLNVSAFLTAVQLGLQPILEVSPEGHPVYAPFPVRVTVPVMMLEHLLLFGVVEAFVTVLVIRYMQKNEPELLE